MMNSRGLIFLCGVVLLFTFSAFQAEPLSASVQRGKNVYQANCMSCHMEKGEGLEGAFPPLAGTSRLTDKGRLVKIIAEGSSGPITVKGVDYSMEMTPIELSDQETADVLNYIRNSWGNKNPVIKVNEIKVLKSR